jgi:hypothetical protein
MLMSCTPWADMRFCLEVVLFLKVLQADYLNEVYNESRTESIGYHWRWGRVTSWTPYGFTGCGEAYTGYFYELWQPNCDNKGEQLLRQHKVYEACEKTSKVCQETEKLWSNCIGLCPYIKESARSIY